MVLFLSFPLIAQNLEVRDDLGHKLTLKDCPGRIISLAPNLTEILFSLDLSQEIIGLTRFCDYPEEAGTKEIVGGLVDLSLEKIHSLKPDLILGFRGNPKKFIERLYRDKLPVYVFESGRTFEDLFRLISRIGQLTCRTKQASHLIAELKDRIITVEKKLPYGKKPEKAFLTLYGQGPGLWTCGRQSYLNYVLEKARLENVASRLKGNWLVYNPEKLIQDNPDLILILCQDLEDFDKAKNWFLSQSAFQKLKAIREGRIYFLDEDQFSRFSPRLVEAYGQLIQTAYGDLLAEGK
jgi:iron complex transport system substrate-binding protein